MSSTTTLGTVTVGTPIDSVVVTGSAMAQWRDGRDVLVTVGGSPELPLTVSVVDCTDGAVLAVHRLTTVTRSHHVSASGTVAWISSWSGANLYRYDLETDRITDLGMPLPGQVIISATTVVRHRGDDREILYGGTFPGGRVFGLDVAADEVTDLGRIAADEDMVRALAWDGDRLWMGTEAHGRLHAWDRETGQRMAVLLPPSAADSTGIDHLAVRNGTLLVHLLPSHRYVVLDLATHRWVEPIEHRVARGVTELDRDGLVHLIALDEDRLVHHDPSTGRSWTSAWTLPAGVAHRPHSGIHLLDTTEGEQVVGIDTYGHLWRHRLGGTGAQTVPTEIPPSGMTIRALGVGPSGRILIGGSVARTTYAEFDPVTKRFHRMTGGPGLRIDAFTSVGDRILFSHYDDGSVYEYDSTRAWTGPSDNPRRLFRLIESHRQERIFALEPHQDEVLIGSTGARGVADGRLLRWSPDRDELVDLGTPIPGHSVASMVSLGDRVLIGTSVQVLGADPSDTSATLALVNPVDGRVEWSRVPQPGAQTISHLTTMPDGQIWGLTHRGHVFRFDPKDRTIRDLVKVGPAGGLWGMGTLHPHQSWLVGATGSGTVFTFDTRTHHVQYLGLGEHAVVGPDGAAYWASADQLVRMPLPTPDTRTEPVDPPRPPRPPHKEQP